MVRFCTYRFYLLIFLAALTLPLPGQSNYPYVIKTVAGAFPLGDGGPAKSALLEFPNAIAVDLAGNLFIADGDNNVIRKVDTTGKISTLAGFKGYTEDLVVDNTGNILICTALQVLKLSPNGTLTTIAGTGKTGFSGDGGRAVSAVFGNLTGMTVDANGNIYVADSSNHRVRKIGADGVIQTIAGTGQAGFSQDGIQATNSKLNFPHDVAVDAGGNIYFSDAANGRIRKIAPDGIISTICGGGSANAANGVTATSALLSYPGGIALDNLGNLLIAQSAQHRVLILAPNGVVRAFAGTGAQGFSGDDGAPTNARITWPTEVAVDSSGGVYIADSQNHRIRKVSLGGGLIVTVAGRSHFEGDGGPALSALLQRPRGIALSPSGEVYISDRMNHRIRAIDSSGNIRTIAGTGETGVSGDGGPAGEARLFFPEGLAFDADGNLFFVDQNGYRVRRITKAGKIDSVAGNSNSPSAAVGDYGPAKNATFMNISGIALDKAGNVFICDSDDHRVRRVAPDGIIGPFAGTGASGFDGDGGPARSAKLNNPQAVTVDASGNVYIGDTDNYKLRKVSPDGTITTIAGTGACCFRGADDGGPAANAVVRVDALSIDFDGSLLLANSNRIRRIDTAGIIRTIAGTGVVEFAGDGDLATSAALGWPSQLAPSPNGDIYFADTMNNRIRKLAINSPSVLSAIDGDGQSGAVGKPLAKPLKMRLYGTQGLTVPMLKINFAVTAGEAVLSSPAAFTDQSGEVLVAVTPTKEGAGAVTASFGVITAVFKFTGVAAAVTPSKLEISDGDAQTATLGTAFAKALKVKVTGSNGAPMATTTVAFSAATTDATLSAASATTDQSGEASVTATPKKAGPITVTASVGSLSVSFKLTASVAADPNTPKISSGGIVQQGYSTPLVKNVSSGAIVTVWGENFARKDSPAVLAEQNGGKLPMLLAGVCVYFGSAAAPIFALNAAQITVHVPAVAPGKVGVQVARNCGAPDELRSAIETVTAQAATPELLYLQNNADGKNPLAAHDAVTFEWIGKPGLKPGYTFKAARAGDYLTIYGVGFGDTNPSMPAGQVATIAGSVIGRVQISIGNTTLTPEEVLYVGLSPSWIGLYQANLRIPQGIPDGDQPVMLQIGDYTTPGGGFLTIKQ